MPASTPAPAPAYDPAFYDAQYNNRARVPDAPAILARWAEDSRSVRRRCAGLYDIAYGDATGERLDLFPTRREDTPLFVFIHGGYWRSLDKSDNSFIAPGFVAEGVNVALLNYALCPAVTMDAIVLQVLQALAWLHRNAGRYGFDPARIVVGGHSAGGHLAAMAACAHFDALAPDLPRDLVKGTLSISGLHELESIRRAPFLNVDLKLDEAAARRLSPADMPTATGAPVVAAVGGEESEAFIRQARLLRERWPAHDGETLVLPGRNHFTVLDDLARPEGALFQAALRLCQAA